jgi:hypothetical protein
VSSRHHKKVQVFSVSSSLCGLQMSATWYTLFRLPNQTFMGICFFFKYNHCSHNKLSYTRHIAKHSEETWVCVALLINVGTFTLYNKSIKTKLLNVISTSMHVHSISTGIFLGRKASVEWCWSLPHLNLELMLKKCGAKPVFPVYTTENGKEQFLLTTRSIHWILLFTNMRRGKNLYK